MRLNIANPIDFIEQLKINGRPFQLVSTLLTKHIITDSAEYYYSSKTGLKPGELNLIKSVKDYVIKNNITANCNRKHIQYINKGIIKNGVIKKDIYEIDIKSAYWYFAHRDNHISTELFNRGNNSKVISKKARLIALGNLAKVKTVIEFDGEKFTKESKFVRSDETENIFFSASAKTDALMNRLKLIAGDNYLFYWCDAIFVKTEYTKDLIEAYLNTTNLLYKTIKVDKIHKTNEYVKVWDQEHPEPRPFMFEKIKIKDLSSIIE